MRLLALLLLLSTAAVEQVHCLPVPRAPGLGRGTDPCPALQLARPEATSTLETFLLDKKFAHNLTALLVVNGMDALSLKRALTAQDGAALLRENPCRVTSHLHPGQKGCGMSAVVDSSASGWIVQGTHGQVCEALPPSV